MSQIGNNIKKLRKVKGLSQQAFAELFNLTRGNISSYEEFRAEPRIEVILQIAKYFSIPIAELLEKQLTVNEILNFEDHFEKSIQLDSKTLTEIP
ncbi:MAG: helix-turn-helix domain-containing protein, partial [Sphingobacterium composti]